MKTGDESMIEILISESQVFEIKNYLPTDAELQDILNEVADEFIDRFITNVETQKTWMDKQIDENSPGWSSYKRKMGYDLRSLIYKDRSFIRENSWDVQVSGSKVTIKMNKDLKNKFYEVGEIFYKNYTEVMPDPMLEEEMKWFIDKFAKHIEKKIRQKMR
jgi:DNA-binding ferritin-like protein (Dps family)